LSIRSSKGRQNLNGEYLWKNWEWQVAFQWGMNEWMHCIIHPFEDSTALSFGMRRVLIYYYKQDLILMSKWDGWLFYFVPRINLLNRSKYLYLSA
jgi:hypothetical protein